MCANESTCLDILGWIILIPFIGIVILMIWVGISVLRKKNLSGIDSDTYVRLAKVQRRHSHRSPIQSDDNLIYTLRESESNQEEE